jgi:enediyne biosynthesis protein E7
VGNNFAMMEITLILAMIAQRYHLDLVPGHPVELELVITLLSKHGILTTLRARKPETVSPPVVSSANEAPSVAPVADGSGCPFTGETGGHGA